MDNLVLRESRVLAHGGYVCRRIVLVGRRPRINQLSDGVTWPASAIEPIYMILDEFDACPESHLHRLKFFEHLIFLDWPLTLPIAPLNDVQGIVISDTSRYTHS